MFVVSDNAAGRCCPVPSVDHAVADSQLALKDSVVHYTCVEGFTPADSSATSTVCDGADWAPALTRCQGLCKIMSVVVEDVSGMLARSNMQIRSMWAGSRDRLQPFKIHGQNQRFATTIM